MRLVLFLVQAFIVRQASSNNAILPQTPPLLNALEKTSQFHKEEDKPKGFFGLVIKWRIGIPIATFADYTAILQFAYPIRLPFNLYEAENKPGGRQKREIRREKLEFYNHLEFIIKRYHLPEKQCLLRTICEVSHIPFEESFIGDLLNLLLRPSCSGGREFFNEDKLMKDYIFAEEEGLKNGNCAQTFQMCPISLFDFLSQDLHKIVDPNVSFL